MRTNSAGLIAAIILAVEGVAVLALAGWQVVALAAGGAQSAVDGIALIVLTIVAAAAMLAFAGATWRGASWGRSGGIVAQLLVLAIALGAVTGGYAQPVTGAIIAVPGAAGLVVLILAVRRAAALKKDAMKDDAKKDADSGP